MNHTTMMRGGRKQRCFLADEHEWAAIKTYAARTNKPITEALISLLFNTSGELKEGLLPEEKFSNEDCARLGSTSSSRLPMDEKVIYLRLEYETLNGLDAIADAMGARHTSALIARMLKALVQDFASGRAVLAARCAANRKNFADSVQKIFDEHAERLRSIQRVCDQIHLEGLDVLSKLCLRSVFDDVSTEELISSVRKNSFCGERYYEREEEKVTGAARPTAQGFSGGISESPLKQERGAVDSAL